MQLRAITADSVVVVVVVICSALSCRRNIVTSTAAAARRPASRPRAPSPTNIPFAPRIYSPVICRQPTLLLLLLLLLMLTTTANYSTALRNFNLLRNATRHCC